MPDSEEQRSAEMQPTDSQGTRKPINIEEENFKLQVHFDNQMHDKGRSHRKVAVLMLSWHPDYTDLDTGKEINGLKSIFENHYGFQVREGKLIMKNHNGAKMGFLSHLTGFLEEFDDGKSLLIIYYAGHGVARAEPNGLALRGDTSRARRNKEVKDIVWQQVEELVELEDVASDMLLIFDCCYAGRAAASRSGGFSKKICEVLGACQANQLTMGPGPDSFTSALTWALYDLSSIPDGFTTAQLLAKLRSAQVYQTQNRPEGDSHPYWSEKEGVHSLRRLRIVPTITQEGAVVEEPMSEPTDCDYFITTSIQLSDIPSEDDISELCKKFKEILNSSDESSKAHHVLWRGLFTADQLKPHMSRVAEAAAWKFRIKLMESRLKKLDVATGNHIVPDAIVEDMPGVPDPEPTEQQLLASAFEAGNMVGDVPPKDRLMSTQNVRPNDSWKWTLTVVAIFGIGFVVGVHREHRWIHSHLKGLAWN